MSWEVRENASNLHRKIMSALKELYPYQLVLQEQTIKVSNGKSLYVDIYLPKLGVMIEADGIQHFQAVGRFHDSKWAFRRQQINDEEKEMWCERNNITLVRFAYYEEKNIDRDYLLKKISEAKFLDK